MDYGRLNRKELQALCKEHGIPANKTNVYMAEALNALLKAPKETEQLPESIPDAAEVVKSRAKRAPSSKKGADVLEETEVADLSSLLARSAIGADPLEVRVVMESAKELQAVSNEHGIQANKTNVYGAEGPRVMELAEEDSSESVVEPIIVVPEIPQQMDVVAEAAKVPRRPRRQTSKSNTKTLSSLVDPTPALTESTLEVVLEVEKPADSICPAMPDVAPESRAYSRRLKVIEPEQAAEIPDSVLTEIPPVTFSPVEETVIEETIVAPKAVTKKSKAKGKTFKNVKPILPMSLPVLEDGIVSSGAPSIPDSPTLGLALEASATDEIPLRAVSLSPLPVEEFEFQPVPASFAEIMTPGKPLSEVTNGRVRNGRKVGKSSKAVLSVTKIANVKQDTLQQVDIAKVDSELESASETDSSARLTTPVKQSDDKENSAKKMDLHTLSLRKLQREVRKGLSRRNDTRAVKV